MECGLIFLISLIFLNILLCFTLYILIRNDRVYIFRLRILNLCRIYCIKHIEKNYKSPIDRFYKKWAYYQMLFSFKPLKLKYWFTEEEIREIREINR